MRIAIAPGLLGAAWLLAACAHHRPAPAPAPDPVVAIQPPKPVIQPDLQVAGQVAMVNNEAHFVVVSFPPGPVPPPGARLNIYRGSLKVGEVKVTGPQHESDTVADITAGDVQVHDEARAE